MRVPHTSRAGWFTPRWPYLSFTVLPPCASAMSWWPRQMPNIGMRPKSLAISAIWLTLSVGSPGPLESMTPSYPAARMSSAFAEQGSTVTAQPRLQSSRAMLRLAP